MIIKTHYRQMKKDFYIENKPKYDGFGLMVNEIDNDIEYMRNKLSAALKIPKEFLGYSK